MLIGVVLVQVGERIALLRKEKGFTQEQIAVKLNITAQAVSKWEKGNALPDTAILPNLAAILEVSIDRLLTGKDLNQVHTTKSTRKRNIIGDYSIHH